MLEKEDENSRVSSGGETELKAWQTTFDVYVGRIPPDCTKVCMIEFDLLIERICLFLAEVRVNVLRVINAIF